MNRRLIGTLVLSGLLFFLLISSMNVARAVPLQQETEQADDTAETAEATTGVDATELLTDTEEGQPLAEPLQITIRQRLPISIDLGQLGLTSEGVTITGALPLELELTIDFRVTDTLTSTVPSTLTLINAGDVLTRLPITMTLGNVTDTLVVVIPQLVLQESEGLTTTETLTESEEITSTPEVTVTLPITAEVEPEQVPEISATPTVTSVEDVTTTETVTPGQTPGLTPGQTPVATPTAAGQEIAPTSRVTANLRSGPATTFDLVGTASPGQELEIVAISNDAEWYLLSSGQWIFAELVDDPPSDVPIATQDLIDEVIAQATAEAETQTTPVATSVPQPTRTPAATSTPQPTATTAVEEDPGAEGPPPTANVDANLRAGPGTQFDIIGGTITGQELDIVGQNSAGDWYLLSNGGWIAATLVNDPPSAAPVVADDASPLLDGGQPGLILVPTPARMAGARLRRRRKLRTRRFYWA